MPQHLPTLTRIVRLLLLLSLAATLGILFGGFDAVAAGGWGGYLGSAAWCAAPYGFLLLLTRRAFCRGATALVLAASVILSVFGCLALLDSFHWNPTADARTAMLFLPLYQWVGAILVTVVAQALTVVERDRAA